MRLTTQRSIRAAAIAALALMMSATASPGGVAIYDPEGVYIDPSGELKFTEVDDNKLKAQRKRALAANPKRELIAISLPEMFTAAIAAQQHGEPVPDEVRYMRGLVKIEGVEVDAESKDIRVVGYAEPFENGIGGRIVGSHSGRPIVHLDDVAAALRIVGPGKAGQPFGCTIQLPAEGVRRFVDEFHRLSTVIIATKHRQRHDIAKILAKAAGEQDIKFFNQAGDTRLALVCVEADYRMKRIALGLDKPAVTMPSYVSMLSKPDTVADRFWLQSKHDAVSVSEDGRRFGISGPSIVVATRKHFADPKPDVESPAAQRFAKIMTSRYEKLAKFDPVFADLANLSDLSLVAAIIGHHRLHERVGWDVKPVVSGEGYRTHSHTVPTRTPVLANWNERAGVAIFTAGGVRLEYAETLANDAEPKP